MTLRRATLLLLALLPALHALAAVTETAPAPLPVDLLRIRLAALADLQNLHQHFTCRRDLAGIDTPLLSSGDFWLLPGTRKSNTLPIAPGAGGALHIRTDSPYISEIILEGGHFAGRTQHEPRWQFSEQSAKPGLTAAMGQLAACSLGDPARLTDWFTVERTPESPAQPETFTLTPRVPDLQKAVRSLALRFDPRSHHLTWARLITAQDDQSTYEFSAIQTNITFPVEVFRAEPR